MLFYEYVSEGGKTMNRHNKHLKDPGSAITHFIGMLMAIFAQSRC